MSGVVEGMQLSGLYMAAEPLVRGQQGARSTQGSSWLGTGRPYTALPHLG